MIICPKCRKENNLILERPRWMYNDETGNFVEVSSYCIKCNISFSTKHKLGKTLKTYDIEKVDE